MAKKWEERENTETQKKENKWIEDEQKEGIKRQRRQSNSVIGGNESEDMKTGTFKMSQHKYSMKRFLTPFLSFKKKRRLQKRKQSWKTLFLTRNESVLKEKSKKRQKKDNQIRDNLQKRDFFFFSLSSFSLFSLFFHWSISFLILFLHQKKTSCQFQTLHIYIYIYIFFTIFFSNFAFFFDLPLFSLLFFV